MKRIFTMAGVGASVGLVAVLAYAALPTTVGSSPRLLPYVGHLDHDGSPVTGKVAMKVCLVPSADTACSAADWSEEFASVDVAGGQFSLVLGQAQPIPDAIYQAPSLFIRGMVGAYQEGQAATYVQLSGAQRVLSVPYAVNVDGATRLRVDGPIHRGTAKPNTSDLGLYSEVDGADVRLVATNGKINLSVDGNAGNGWAPPNPAVSISSQGLRIGGSRPIKQITSCRKTSTIGGYDSLTVSFTGSDCNNGLPSGNCFGMLSRTEDACGQTAAWTVLMPGEGGTTNGGIRWYNHNRCSSDYDVGAVYFCTDAAATP